MGNIVVIYALCDPDTLEYRYVGATNNVESRLRCHRWEVKSSKLHNHKINWLRSLSKDPVVEILQKVDSLIWQQAEIWWIAQMRQYGARLTNYADGGQTSPVAGKGHTEETKIKCREASIRLGLKPPSRKGIPPPNKGIPPTLETRARISDALKGHIAWNKGKVMSAESIEKNRLGHLDKPWSLARREAQNRRMGVLGG